MTDSRDFAAGDRVMTSFGVGTIQQVHNEQTVRYSAPWVMVVLDETNEDVSIETFRVRPLLTYEHKTYPQRCESVFTDGSGDFRCIKDARPSHSGHVNAGRMWDSLGQRIDGQ